MATLRLLIALTLTGGSVAAQQAPQQPAERQKASLIEGIWQFHGTRNQPDAEFRRSSVTILKILSGDGVITNLAVTPKGSAITARGTYTVESDSVYTEHIRETPGNRAIDGKKVRIFYQIRENNHLYVRFFLENDAFGAEAPATYEELWIRVGIPKLTGIPRS